MYQETPTKTIRLKPWVIDLFKWIAAIIIFGLLIWGFSVSYYLRIDQKVELRTLKLQVTVQEKDLQIKKMQEEIDKLKLQVKSLTDDNKTKDLIISKLSNRKVFELPKGSVLKVEETK